MKVLLLRESRLILVMDGSNNVKLIREAPGQVLFSYLREKNEKEHRKIIVK